MQSCNPQPGPNTWPIALVSYVYIRKDLSFMANPASRTLLKAFATALYDPDYIGLCDRFGHIPVPDVVKNLALEGIAMVDTGDAPEWTFEKETMPGIGMGDTVISRRRQNFALYEADNLYDDVEPLKEDLRALKLELASMKAQSLGSSGAAGLLTSGVAVGLGAVAAVVLSLY